MFAKMLLVLNNSMFYVQNILKDEKKKTIIRIIRKILLKKNSFVINNDIY